MVKVTAPLLSEKASGSVGVFLTFSERKSGSQVRFQKKQKDRQSEAQQDQRSWYLEAVAGWNELDGVGKANYNARAKTLIMTGFNLYIKEFVSSSGTTSIYGERIFGVLIYGNF